MINFDEVYYSWLVDRGYPTNNVEGYNALFELLFKTEYDPLKEMDQNRRDDGLELRIEWADIFGMDPPKEWFEQPCSILEAIIALAARCEFQSSRFTENEWVTMLLENMGILMNAYELQDNIEFVRRVLDDFNDGVANVFPNSVPGSINKELWYQMMDYLSEIDPL